MTITETILIAFHRNYSVIKDTLLINGFHHPMVDALTDFHLMANQYQKDHRGRIAGLMIQCLNKRGYKFTRDHFIEAFRYLYKISETDYQTLKSTIS